MFVLTSYQVHPLTYLSQATLTLQANLKGRSASLSLDPSLEHLKQFRVSVVATHAIQVERSGALDRHSVWLEYAYHKHHLVPGAPVPALP